MAHKFEAFESDPNGHSSDLSWRIMAKKILVECKIFSVHQISATSECDRYKRREFFTLNCNAWVNIIALTDDLRVVMVEQYRHGTESVTLEIPGGGVDLVDKDPETAARRELREETGYVAEHWLSLGKSHPNPALQDNVCYTYLAEGVKQIEKPRFDEAGTENLVTRYFELSEIAGLIQAGVISHALVITAFYYLALERPHLFQRVRS